MRREIKPREIDSTSSYGQIWLIFNHRYEKFNGKLFVHVE